MLFHLEVFFRNKINFLIKKVDLDKFKNIIFEIENNNNEKLFLLKYISNRLRKEYRIIKSFSLRESFLTKLRERNDLGKSLINSDTLVKSIPLKWEGYKKYIYNLLSLNKFRKAKRFIDKDLYQIKIYNKQKKLNINRIYRNKLLKLKSEVKLISKEPILFALPYEVYLKNFLDEKRIFNIKYKYKRELLTNKNFPKTSSEKIEKKAYLCRYAYVTNYYGVHDLHGNPFLNTVLRRGPEKYPHGFPVKISAEEIKVSKRIEKAFYIPYFGKHFGHRLTEGISAISLLLFLEEEIARNNFKLPIILPNQFKGNASFLKNFFGLEEGQILIPGINCGDLFIKNLYLSKPTLLNKVWSTKNHSEAVKIYLKRNCTTPIQILNNLTKYEKVYISRSNLPKTKRLLKDEKKLEEKLRHLGWYIFHPQEHPIDIQLKTYENANFICSQASSALHLLYGLKTNALKKVIMLYQDNINLDYKFQFITQKINLVIIKCLKLVEKSLETKTVRHVELQDISLNKLSLLIEKHTKI